MMQLLVLQCFANLSGKSDRWAESVAALPGLTAEDAEEGREEHKVQLVRQVRLIALLVSFCVLSRAASRFSAFPLDITVLFS